MREDRSESWDSASLPRLGLGTAALGNLFAPVPDSEALATLATARAGGPLWLDTAPYYGHGLAERRVGAFLRAHAGEPVRLSTKVGRTLIPAEPAAERDGFVGADPARAIFDYSAGAVRRQVADSFARLGVARVNLLLVHDIGRLTHGDDHTLRMSEARAGAFPELRRMKAEGLTDAIGIGVNEIEVCLEVLESEPIDAILLAGRYSLLEQEPLDALLPRAVALGVAVIVGGPFNSGVLAGGNHYDYGRVPPHVARKVGRLREQADRHGVPLGAAALQFPLGHPAVVSVLAGARSAAEVAQHQAWMAHPIPPAFWEALRADGLLHPMAPVPA
ncbi:MAG: aldo/keto reductase [Sphingomonadaceae bacterium]